MNSFILRTVLIATLSLCLVPSFAMAQDDDDDTTEEPSSKYDTLMNEGKTLYKDKKFEAALSKFQAAYELKANPKLLFNMGIICERLGQLENAVKYYDKFVVSPEVSLDLRAKGQRRLDVLRPIVKAQKQKKQDAQNALDAKNNKKKDNDKKKGGDLKTDEGSSNLFTYAVTGTGAALAITGGVLLLTMADEMAFVEEPTPDERRAARSSRATIKTTGIVLVSLGTAAFVTGAVMWALSDDEKETTAWQVAPSVGPSQASVFVFKRF